MSGTHDKEIPATTFQQPQLQAIAYILKEGYFARTTRNIHTQVLTKLCFEPALLLTVGQLAEFYPKYSEVPDLPEYKKPDAKQHIEEIMVYLHPDNSFYAGNDIRRWHVLPHSPPTWVYIFPGPRP